MIQKKINKSIADKFEKQTNRNHFKVVKSKLSCAILLATASLPAFSESITVGDTNLTLYGYAKLDLIYDFDSPLGISILHQNIRLDDTSGPDGHFDAHALESRIGISTVTPTELGNIETRVEGDFYGPGGTFRLRQGYGTWNGILAGQTETNFSTFLGYTPSIDFTGQVRQTNLDRQAQIRYSTGGLSIALEEADKQGGLAYETEETVEIKSTLPDLTLRYDDALGGLNYSLGAVLRQLTVYDAAADREEDEFGYGVTFSGKMPVSSRVSLQGAVVYGEGVGGYLWLNPAAPAYYDPVAGELEAIEAVGGTLGISVAVGPGLANLAYGVSEADLDDIRNVDVSNEGEQNTSLYLNYLWSPIESVDYGIEVSHHTRELVGGREGKATRLQAMAKYTF